MAGSGSGSILAAVSDAEPSWHQRTWNQWSYGRVGEVPLRHIVDRTADPDPDHPDLPFVVTGEGHEMSWHRTLEEAKAHALETLKAP